MPLQLTWFSGEFSSSSISILPLSVENCHQAMPPLLCLVQAASFWSSIPSVPSRWPFFTSFLFPQECPARPFLPVGIKRDPYETILQRSKLVVKHRLPFRTEYMPPFWGCSFSSSPPTGRCLPHRRFWHCPARPLLLLEIKKGLVRNRALTTRSQAALLCVFRQPFWDPAVVLFLAEFGPFGYSYPF